jgi:lactate dehydrogenase-like 2-hydroxyacid dehydrogenase
MRRCGIVGARVEAWIIYNDIVPNPQDLLEQLGATYRDVDALLAEANYVSINADLNESTHGLIDERRLRLMKPTAFLVNTARRAIVQKEALVRALKEKRIAGRCCRCVRCRVAAA